YSVRVNGITDIALTKLDVLSGFERVKVAVAYDSLEQRYTDFPRQQRVLFNCHPVYEELEGWSEDISGVRTFDDLPKAAQRYIEFVEDVAGAPVSMVSVGPERSATLPRS
ncbi:MAG: adenylosuccinate synthetase, partial [Acidimicrobiia bacterium]|nr:adenylosuccinate synthetase [Acidimicrobiia bacterium]